MIICITFTSLGHSLLYHRWTLRRLFFMWTKLFWSKRDFKHKTLNSVNCFKPLKQFLLGKPMPSQNVKPGKFNRILYNGSILSPLCMCPKKSIVWFAKPELQHQQTYTLSDLFLFTAFKEVCSAILLLFPGLVSQRLGIL